LAWQGCIGRTDAEDYGWKLIHGDVFRFPAHKMRLAAIVGTLAAKLFVCIGTPHA